MLYVSERTALYVYALGYEPPFPMDPAAGSGVAPARQTAIEGVSGRPCHAHDVARNVLAADDDFRRLHPDVPAGTEQARPLPEQNLIRRMLLREGAR
ncbi:hypothetical protein [Streptomyces sp. NPDC001100]